MASQRDNFKAATKELLALRVGYRCSNPKCRTLTIAPSSAPDGTVNIGVAAHICAASPGGMRYDAAMSPEQRSGADNGIWLCQNCSKIIDSDDKYDVGMLHGWRSQSERVTVREIQTRRIAIPIEATPMLEDMDGNAIALANLGLANDIGTSAHAASLADIAKLKLLDTWPTHVVNLGLTGKDEKGSYEVTDLGSTIRAARELAIVSQPGTGKTTTLIQAAESILQDASQSVGFIRLGNWAHEARGLLEAVAHREAFQGLTEANLLMLAKQNHFTLILDGWNELDQTARNRAASEVERLRFDYPMLRIVISTRKQATELPISGLTFEVQPLSEEQQLEIARSFPNGQEVYDRAIRTKGVRELVAIPLYFQALLANATDGALPTTKEEVLRLFVEGHEKKRAHAEAFQTAIQGNHRPVLIALAVATTPTGNTFISDATARTVISTVENALVESGQMSIAAPAPNFIIDILVSHHVIVRSGEGSVGFQHQQLLEWHASFEVEKVMNQSSASDYEANARLVHMLDSTAWEEPVLFACERLSRAHAAGQDAVAKAIVETLTIDPMLAAEMIYRSSSDVWGRIAKQVREFVEKWHQSPKIDRAVRFAIMTGRPEFSELIWPFLASTDQQLYLRVLRHAPRFRPSVLGADCVKRLSELSEEQREHVLGEIASNSGMEGMELATKLAVADTSIEVKNDVIMSLLFRRCDRLAAQILNAGPEKLWESVAAHRMADYFADKAVKDKLRNVQLAMAKIETSKFRLLERLVEPEEDDQERVDSIEQAVFEMLVDPLFPMDDGHAHWSVSRAAERFPATVRKALIQRFELGLSLPFQCDAMIGGGEPIDAGPIPEMVFIPDPHHQNAALAATLIGEATASRMLDRLFNCFDDGTAPDASADAARKAEFWAVERRTDLVPATPLAKAWLAWSGKAAPKHYGFMAEVWAGHGKDVNRRGHIELADTLRTSISDVLTGWAAELIADEHSRRNDLSKIAQAIGRLALQRDVPVLERLLTEDLRRREAQLKEFIDSGGRVDRNHEARTVFGLQYRHAFANIKTRDSAEALRSYLMHPEMGKEAAWAMKDIQEKPQPEKEGVWRGNEIGAEEVNDRRALIAENKPAEEAWEATQVFNAVEALIGQDTNDVQHKLALRIVCAATYMPHQRRPDLIKRLSALTVPWSAKQEYMRALAWSGEVLSADDITAAIAELYERAKTQTWLLQHGHTYELREWLALLPFSDRPIEFLTAYAALPKYSVDNHELETVVRALGKIDHPEAETVLFALADANPQWIGNHAWVGAVLARGTESAITRHLELAENDQKALGPHGGYQYQRQLHEVLTSHPQLRSALLKRYRAGEFQRPKGPVERVLAQTADSETVLMLVEAKGPRGIAHARELSGAVDAAVLEHRPAGGNSYEIHGVNAAGLRKSLFDMLDGPCGPLAKSCLVQIDKMRDEHGRVEFEPRHPNIDSKKPWPLLD